MLLALGHGLLVMQVEWRSRLSAADDLDRRGYHSANMVATSTIL